MPFLQNMVVVTIMDKILISKSLTFDEKYVLRWCKTLSAKLLNSVFNFTSAMCKVIIEKSRGEVSLMGQDTIENVS